MTKETIDREAGDSGKGFRLQQIRAIKLMLHTIQQNSNSVFFTAVENVEDVSHQIIESGGVSSYYEEDKNYDTNGNFTIFSPPVINTLVSFFDIYVNQLRSSDNVLLGFYTTRSYGKERKSKLDNGTAISLPSDPILKLLMSNEIVESTLILVKSILVEEYINQYTGKSSNGHLDTLKDQSTDDFRDFLSAIKWHFGQEDEEALKGTVLQEIQKSPLHNNAHIGKENTIFCMLMEKLEEKQNSKNLIDKLVHSSDVKLIFKEAESYIPDENIDPTWKYITELEKEVTDKRNLEEKVLSVIHDFPTRKMRQLARKASASKYEEYEADKTFLSLKYRVLEACEEHFNNDSYKSPKSYDDMDSILKEAVDKAVNDLSELKKDYKYSVSNSKTIEGIVWNLFDGCFLSFEEASNE